MFFLLLFNLLGDSTKSCIGLDSWWIKVWHLISLGLTLVELINLTDEK